MATPAKDRITNLVLTRYLGQALMINGETRVTLISIKGKQIRLAFEAPESVRIVRAEAFEQNDPGSA